jgi:hypothetical protein
LCVRAIAAEGADFQQALDDLHKALKNHIENIRAMAASALLPPSVQPQDFPET